MTDYRLHDRSGKRLKIVNNNLITIRDKNGNQVGEFYNQSEDELSVVFETADVEELSHSDPIEDAIEEPTDYVDYLKVEGGEITFDYDHERGDDQS